MRKKWPFLWDLVEKGSLLSIDCALAGEAKSESEAALLAALFAFYRMGHLCLKVEKEAIYPSLSLLTPQPEELERLIRLAPESPFVVQEGSRFYLPKAFAIEQQFVAETLRLLKNSSSFPIEKNLDLPSLTEEQKKAVERALQFPLSLIAGGPGTGKSFTASAIAETFLRQGHSHIFLAAPTGKAAANLEKKLPGLKATTLHKLLQISSSKDFKEPPPWIYMDLLLVDECSMIDPLVFTRLMRAVQGKTHLVLLGDPHQLPAVEGGSFFADLLSSKALPSTELTASLRFHHSDLVALSEAILLGDSSRVPCEPFPKEEQLWERIFSHFPRPASHPEEDLSCLNRFRLLTPLRKGPFGVEALNRRFLSRFQALGSYGQYLTLPILISKTDRRTGLCNGQSGALIHRVGKSEEDYAIFEGGERFMRKELPSFEYAYAISVHKSQGSEYEEGLLLIPEGAESFGRELLYTGATRARKKLTIAGEKQRVALLLKQVSGKVSGVKEKLVFSSSS